MMNAGIGKANITPPVGLPLSGFAVRRNRPSSVIDDPLFVKSLVIESGPDRYLLLSYDLLALDRPLDTLVRARVQDAFGGVFSAGGVLVTTTHTHSGPTTAPIAGETRVPEAYINQILASTGSAVKQALNHLAPVALLHASRDLEGINHNRRERYDSEPVSNSFPLDKTLDLYVFRGQSGEYRGGVVRFSCHAVTMLTQHISADYPGELTARLERQFGAPVLFLEGTAGDSNPTTHTEDHAAMIRFVDRIMEQIEGMTANLRPAAIGEVRVVEREFTLPFAKFPDREKALEIIAQHDRILAGDITFPDLAPLVSEYAAWRSSGDTDLSGTVLHWAEVFRVSALRTLQAVDHPQEHAGVPFRAAGLLLGETLFLFLSGEILTRLGMHIQALAPGKQVKVISYLSPIVGYIADAGEYDLGGYELDNAWMWYGMPGPFDRESEKIILQNVSILICDLFEE